MSIYSSHFAVSTTKRTEMIDVTERVAQAVSEAQAQNGIVYIFVPHTTAAITINENADPDVVHDVLQRLLQLIPLRADDRHAEGNSDAHLKTMLVGSSVMVIVTDGALQLGEWQGIFFCEFDGPRRRNVWLKIIAE